jgi:hypothetical protein
MRWRVFWYAFLSVDLKKQRTFLNSPSDRGSYIWRGAQKGMMALPW